MEAWIGEGGLVRWEGEKGRGIVVLRPVGFSLAEAGLLQELVRRLVVEAGSRKKERKVRVEKPLKIVVRLELKAEVARARAASRELGTPDKAEWAEIFKGVLFAWLEGRYD